MFGVMTKGQELLQEAEVNCLSNNKSTKSSERWGKKKKAILESPATLSITLFPETEGVSQCLFFPWGLLGKDLYFVVKGWLQYQKQLAGDEIVTVRNGHWQRVVCGVGMMKMGKDLKTQWYAIGTGQTFKLHLLHECKHTHTYAHEWCF